jgi:hypothetical protein
VRFAREEAARLDELRLDATELLLQAHIALGETDSVAERAGQFVAAHPFRERRWCALMLALYRCGRQSEALAAAARLRRTLAIELGVDPSPDVRRLEEQILQQNPSCPSRLMSSDSPSRRLPRMCVLRRRCLSQTMQAFRRPMWVRRWLAGTTSCPSSTSPWRRPSRAMVSLSFCTPLPVWASPASWRRWRSVSWPTAAPCCVATA